MNPDYMHKMLVEVPAAACLMLWLRIQLAYCHLKIALWHARVAVWRLRVRCAQWLMTEEEKAMYTTEEKR